MRCSVVPESFSRSRVRLRAVRLAAVALSLAGVLSAQVVLKTGLFGIRLTENGRVQGVVAEPGGETIADIGGAGNAFVWIRQGGTMHAPSNVVLKGGVLTAEFADAGVSVDIEVGNIGEALRLHVRRVSGEGITMVTFADITLPKAALDAGWGVSVAALNEFTQGIRHPGMQPSGRASCFPRFGFDRGEAALVVARADRMRQVLKQVVEGAEAIPKSTIGGPFAVEAPNAYGSYLFAGSNVTEENVDDIIDLADRLGLNQLNMHPVRYGDWEPYPKFYPEGRASLKRVVDKIHAAGMLAGVHTYSEFINKSSPYVTPVPDPRLGVDAEFTLAADLPAEATLVPVVESTADMSAVTGFFIRNSATVRIGDELIVYKGVAKTAPFGFTECTRGAYGTTVSAHPRGAKVSHLRECFGLFVPDGDSSLFDEVARRLADLINECGFDMVYLDALDGSDAVAGREWSWHYAAKFTLEIFRHLNRPVLAEMSTFPHHLWYVRSRSGAWDHPTRSHKVFIDIHAESNRALERIFLPSHLGWWRYKTFHTFAEEPTYSDDIAHLGVRCLGYNSGVSIQGVNSTTLRTVPALTRLAAITRRHEVLRRAGYFDDDILAQLRVTGHEFDLQQLPTGRWVLRPSTYTRHKVTATDNGSQRWTVANDYVAQAPFIRIQALHTAGPYEQTADRVLDEFADAAAFADYQAVRTMKATLVPVTEPVKVGATSALLTATNTGDAGAPCWARWTKTFDPPISLSGREAMGVWVHGDGKGEILNLQLRSPIHLTYAHGEHYITVDFTGWKYFELIEPDAEDYRKCSWPYRSWYTIYRSTPRYNAISDLTVYVNNVPPGETVTCALSPVRGLPLVEQPIVNPSITVGDSRATFPVTIPTGSYLEYDGRIGRLFGRQGELRAVVRPEGDSISLAPGTNEVAFGCDVPEQGLRSRAMVTLGRFGEPMKNSRPTADVKWDEMAREVDLPQQILALDGEQNRWTTIVRGSHAIAPAFELTVHRVTPPEQPYESPDAQVIDTFDDLDTFEDSPTNAYLKYVRSGARVGFATSEGVTHDLTLSTESRKAGAGAFLYTARSDRPGGWSARGRRFEPLLELQDKSHIGFWIEGDGRGETLYFQLRDTKGAHVDMKTVVNFTGWRLVHFELAKPDFDFGAVEYLILYYNNLPANQTVACRVDEMRAYSVTESLKDPRMTSGGRTLTFPIELHAGDILSYAGPRGPCDVRRGAERIAVSPRGGPLLLQPGTNDLVFDADAGPGVGIAVTAQLIKEYGGR